MTSPLIDRRASIVGAGIGLLSSLHPAAAHTLQTTDAIFASAYRAPNGKFGIATLSEEGELLDTYALPSRGHDVVWKPRSKTMVAFARRPCTFAAVIDIDRRVPPITITCPDNRHFYGHGCFSANGAFLYATENDLDNARGVVGVYDAKDQYRRIAEFDTGGTGPHDIGILPDGKTLVIANGGIETHPDYPRAKLNTATMKPNIALVDASNGAVISTFELAPEMHKLSIRHTALDAYGTVWFACQNDGDTSLPISLAGSLSVDGKLQLLDARPSTWKDLRGYVGSIACLTDGSRILLTSPRGGIGLELNTKTGA